ncbi:hypothetical protein VTK73DRAFT_3586 [Phialemonium thermophilum]|uniref:Uncharacterized protein n=1 Tax=Phialemonium thermophilum TaxID=223376 RepID=A0ABR3VH66_9PEZI
MYVKRRAGPTYSPILHISRDLSPQLDIYTHGATVQTGSKRTVGSTQGGLGHGVQQSSRASLLRLPVPSCKTVDSLLPRQSQSTRQRELRVRPGQTTGGKVSRRTLIACRHRGLAWLWTTSASRRENVHQRWLGQAGMGGHGRHVESDFFDYCMLEACEF